MEKINLFLILLLCLIHVVLGEEMGSKSEWKNEKKEEKPSFRYVEGDHLKTKMFGELFQNNVKYVKSVLGKIKNHFAQRKSEKQEELQHRREREDKTDHVLTPQQLKSEELFKNAQNMLTSLTGNKKEAYALLREASRLGNSKAELEIAWAQLFGNDIPQDLTTSRNTFEKLASQGIPDAHTALGFIYAAGITVEANNAEADVHYMIGALGGSILARLALGYRYWVRKSVNGNCEKPLGYYRLVADSVVKGIKLSGGVIIQRVRLLDEVDNPEYNSGVIDKDLVDYYQLLAEKGEVQSQVGLGQLYYLGGRGLGQDYQKALHYFLQAADAGSAIAMGFLGRIYLEGSETVKPDNATAYNYFQKSAEKRNPVGQSGLGLMYLKGIGVEQDYTKAFEFFSKSAEQGWVEAHVQLGLIHLEGLGVKRDYKLAIRYFTKASQSGNILGLYNLAQMHASGTGVIRSCTTALELFKNVAERGKWGGKLMEANKMYRNGKYTEAFVHYAFMSELGYEVGQSNTAYMLEKNHISFNVPDRYIKAKAYWGRAAGQGYSSAQVKLGDYYYYGLGTDVDYAAAAMHYTMASDQQYNAQAMFNLGYMHEQGLGMEQDIHLAKRYYDMAAEASREAKIPVALALLKLYFISNFKYLKVNWMGFYLYSKAYWDLYLVTLLVIILGILNFHRRPFNLAR